MNQYQFHIPYVLNSMAATLTLIFAFVLCILVLIYREFKRPKNYPPGPTWLPFIGNLRQLKQFNQKYGGQHIALTKLAEHYNTNVLGMKLGGEYVITVSSYAIVHKILTRDDYVGRPNSFFIRLRCMGTRRGITCTDGPFWSEQRNFVVRHLRQIGFGKKPMENAIHVELDDILSVLNCEGPDIQLGKVFAPSVLNVIWTMATGMKLSRNDNRLKHFLDLLDQRSKAFDMAGGTMSQLPWLRFIIPEQIGYNFLLRINQSLKAFFMETIKEHHSSWYPDREDDLIYAYISEMHKNEESMKTYTDDQLIIILLDLFLAGSLTTSSFIDFIFLRMLLHPDIQEKAFNSMEQALDPAETLTYADRLKLPYLEAVVLEIARHYGVAPIAGPRRVLRDTTLEGYDIPKESTVLINIHSVHFEKEYWGDPEVFRPERFLDEQGRVVYNERILNFGLGRRRCLGELLARQCIFIFFGGIIRKYKICPIPESELPSPKPVPGITLSPQKYLVRLVSRNQHEL